MASVTKGLQEWLNYLHVCFELCDHTRPSRCLAAQGVVVDYHAQTTPTDERAPVATSTPWLKTQLRHD